MGTASLRRTRFGARGGSRIAVSSEEWSASYLSVHCLFATSIAEPASGRGEEQICGNASQKYLTSERVLECKCMCNQVHKQLIIESLSQLFIEELLRAEPPSIVHITYLISHVCTRCSNAMAPKGIILHVHMCRVAPQVQAYRKRTRCGHPRGVSENASRPGYRIGRP